MIIINNNYNNISCYTLSYTLPFLFLWDMVSLQIDIIVLAFSWYYYKLLLLPTSAVVFVIYCVNRKTLLFCVIINYSSGLLVVKFDKEQDSFYYVTACIQL